MATTAAEKMIHGLLHDNMDPKAFRCGIAKACRIPVEEVDALIATAGAPREVSEETVARERLAEERRFARQHRAEWRAYNHEED